MFPLLVYQSQRPLGSPFHQGPGMEAGSQDLGKEDRNWGHRAGHREPEGSHLEMVDMVWCQLEARACYLGMGCRAQLQPLC